MEKTAARLGAVLYVCWGLLHIQAAYGVYRLAQNSPPTMAQGRLMQTAFYLTVFAATAIVLAVTLNWRNDRLGFLVNGVTVGIADIPFILFVLAPVDETFKQGFNSKDLRTARQVLGSI